MLFPKPSKTKRGNTKNKLHFEGDNDYRKQAIDYINNYYVK